MPDPVPQQSQNPAPTTTPATTTPDFSAIPGHQEEKISAPEAPETLHHLAPGQQPREGAGGLHLGESIENFTTPIENYTPAGREEHPILSRLGDVTRGVKELLEGGQAAGKPMGTSSGVANNPVTQAITTAPDAAEQGAKAEELARKYAPKVASHLAETGHNFLTGILEDARAGLEATAPEGSTEAGFAKIPGYRSEQPKIGATVSGDHVVTHIQNTSHNPFGTGEYKISREEAHQLAGLDSGGDYKLQRVPIDSIKATNDTDPALAQQYAKKKSPLPAVVLDMDGNIRDGNHRLAAAKLRGDKDVLAYVPQDSYEAPTTKPTKLKPPVEVNPDAEATKKAEDDLAAARANYVHDMEKNPTTFPKGTPVHEQVVYVDPNKVIAKVNPGGNTFNEATVQKYQQMIRNGEDIPAARIEYSKTGEVRGYDGRHRAEAARREGTPVKLWTRREVEPGEAPPTTIGHEEPQAHELNGDETPESANGNILESQQAATEEEGAYHPDLQALADKHGVTDDPYKISHGSSVITPDGKFIHGNSGDDPAFVNNTGAIQTRATFDNSGHTLNVTVPSTGVNPDQVDALKHATSQALGNGKSGKVVIHLADGTKYAERPSASAATIEPALKALGVHPNSYIGSQAEKLPVNSSHIQHWGYDPKADTLHVTFKDGGEYRMEGVDGRTWAALQKDPSPGKAFNRLVRGKYPGQKTK